MNKQNLLEKRYLMRLLALILEGGGKSNQEIAERLGISASSTYKQLVYLEKQGIIFKERDKESDYNRKVYNINNRLTELFLRYISEKEEIKDVLKFKNNPWIDGTLCVFIFSILNKKDNQNVTLKNIFDSAFNYFLSGEISLTKRDEEFLIKTHKGFLMEYKVHKDIQEKTKKEFKEFILTLKKNFRKREIKE